MLFNPADVRSLSESFRQAKPFPFVCIDDFLDPDFARQVAEAYPQFEDSARVGKMFSGVNESRKVQVTDYRCFPPPLQRLADALAASETLQTLSALSGIPNLVWDDSFSGGGIHQTQTSGLLDVHVDFNLLPRKNLYRRLNLLIYFNPVWESAWGGRLELWNKNVTRCWHAFEPIFNRCVLFETSEISFHGVETVRCPANVSRNSFAVYYYTREPGAGFCGNFHATQFRARPEEPMKRYLWMPMDSARRRATGMGRNLKSGLKKILSHHD